MSREERTVPSERSIILNKKRGRHWIYDRGRRENSGQFVVENISLRESFIRGLGTEVEGFVLRSHGS